MPFEIFGTQLLVNTLKNSELILMDEIGMMEKSTVQFKEQIMKCLDAHQPVLGAFQKRATWFSNILKERYDTKIFFAEKENRETIHRQILSFLYC